MQLLVKPAMVGMYTAFDEVLRKLRNPDLNPNPSPNPNPNPNPKVLRMLRNPDLSPNPNPNPNPIPNPNPNPDQERVAKYSTLSYRAPEMVDLYRKHEVG